jgi:hypothetical protein
MRLKHELWDEEDGSTVCLAGRRGDQARSWLSPNAKLIWTVEAESYYEAMTAYYRFMGWGEYKTDHEWDYQPYPPEWAEE